MNSFYRKKPRRPNDCEDGPMEMSGSLQERMWTNQLQNKQIIINGEIREDLIEKAVIHIFNYNEIDEQNEQQVVGYERQPILIFINSPGGYMDEAFSLISAIETSKTPVYTIVLGKAMSAGFLIALAGHKRFCQKYSTMMYHQGSAGISDNFGKMMEYAKYWESCQDMVEEYVKSRTKIKGKRLKEIFHHKQDWYINPKEAVELGIVDEIA